MAEVFSIYNIQRTQQRECQENNTALKWDLELNRVLKRRNTNG